MTERERTDAGTFAETVTLKDVRAVFDEVRGPVITSSDVSDTLDCTTEAARQKLTRLYDKGEVDKRKTGRTFVYWRTGGGRITPGERVVESDAEKRRQETGESIGSGAGVIDHDGPITGGVGAGSNESQETPDTPAQDAEVIDADRRGEDPVDDDQEDTTE